MAVRGRANAPVPTRHRRDTLVRRRRGPRVIRQQVATRPHKDPQPGHRRDRRDSLGRPALLRLGLFSDVMAARDHAPAQAVARGLWRHPARFDGLEYPTRHDTGERSVAVFDPAQGAVPAGAVVRSAALDPRGPLVTAWIRRYGFPVFDDR